MTPYLGEVVFEGKPFTRVQPRARDEKGSWKVYQDWREVMPPEGKAFSPTRLPFHVGELFAFDIEENKRPTKEGDQQIVSKWAPVEEVLDFRNRKAESARRLIVETGLQAMLPGTSHIIVALPDRMCVRVRMEKNNSGSGFIAQWDGLSKLATYEFSPAVFRGDMFGGRFLSVPDVTIGAQVGVTNWCADSELLEVVLKRLRKVNEAGDPPFRLAQIGPLITYLERATLLPTLGSDWDSLRERVDELSVSLQGNMHAINEMVDLIASLEPVEVPLKEELAQRRAEIEGKLRLELEARVRADLESSYSELIEARTRLENEQTELEALTSLVRGQVAETEAAREELRAALRDELVHLRGELEELPASEVTAAKELSARIGARLRTKGVETELVPLEAPPWARVRRRLPEPLRDWAVALEKIKSAAKRFGFSPEEMLLADVAARSGSVVVLPETIADLFVRAYASAVSGGDMVRQALDPSILSVDDLWGQPGGRRATAFANAWVAATLDARRFRVVLLDGLQRTPMNLWIPSFLDVVAAPGRPRNLLVFATLSQDAVDPARAWRGLSSTATGLMAKRLDGVSSEMFPAWG